MQDLYERYDVFEEMDPDDVDAEWVEDQFREVLVAAIEAGVPAEDTREAWESALADAIEETR